MKKIYLSISLLFSIATFSQLNNKVPYTPNIHSPETSSLGKYLDYPVDISTGIPKIEIPLYEVISGKLKLPISISYHASGIKVNQEESNVGLGWTLNAGGAIIRNVKDVPDEYSNLGFLFTGNSIPVINDINDFSGPVGITGNNDLLKSYYGKLNYMSAHKDTSSDTYRINTNLGISGEFYINNNLQFVSAEFDPVNINANLPLNVIELKDERGNLYRFGKSLQNEDAFEKTTSLHIIEGKTTDYLPYTSTWLLTEVISADGTDIIQIKYRKNSGYSISSLIEKRSYTRGDLLYTPAEKKSVINQSVWGYSIDKILSKDGIVQFDYAFDRKDRSGIVNDSNNIPRVSGLTIFNKKNEVIKKVVLDNDNYFDRFESSLLSNYNSQPIPKYHLKSLKLNGVKFLDKKSNLDSKYSFDYDSTILPTKNSGSIDFWGYYNGKLNSTLLPTANSITSYVPNFFSYVNRETNFQFMKAATLTKITYPTGGSTVYEYEPNYFLTSKQEIGMVLKTGSMSAYALKSDANCQDGQSLTTSPHTIIEYPVPYEIDGPTTFTVFFSDYYRNTTPFSPPTAKITHGGFTKEFTSYQNGFQTPMKVETVTTNLSPVAPLRLELNVKDASSPSMSSPCSSPFISVEGKYQYWAPAPPQEIKPQEAGGLRVKSISSYDNNNLLMLRKSYEYGSKKSGPNNTGVGRILSNPYELENYYRTLELRRESMQTLCRWWHPEIVWLNANPMIELGNNNGSPVYYDKVVEYIEDKNDATKTTGKTEYFYSAQETDFIPSADFYRTYNTFIYPSWKKGRLLKKIDYKKENNQYFPIYSEDNVYQDLIESRIRTFNIFEQDSEELDVVCNYTRTEILGYQLDNPNRFRYFNDYISLGKKVLNTKTIEQYFYNGSTTEPITTKTKYQYNNPQHYQLTKEIQTYPDNKISETNIAYAHEKNNTKLINANIIGIPLETTIVAKQNAGDLGKIISKNEIKYDNLNNLLPSSVITYDIGTNTPITEVTFELYDISGNLVQYTTKDGISTVIIWGYSQTKPIIKIENAKLSDINQSAINTIVGASDTDAAAGTNNDETDLLDAFKTFKNSFPHYQITTYTYDPLIGVRSITPPSGIREIYLYDDAGRLKEIREHNKTGKLLKEFNYHYKN